MDLVNKILQASFVSKADLTMTAYMITCYIQFCVQIVCSWLHRGKDLFI